LKRRPSLTKRRASRKTHLNVEDTPSTGGAGRVTDQTDLFDGIAVARSEWKQTIKSDGGHCPVCDRWGRVYSRRINKTMMKSLIWLHHSSPTDGPWTDIPLTAPRWLVRSNQLPTLRWWGLVERRTNDDLKKKHSGMWRVTTKGREFIAGTLRVPSMVFTYNGEPVGWSETQTAASDHFEDFDYSEVMA